MTPAIVMDYIKRRMNEMGYSDQFITRFRHLVLDPMEVLTIHTGKDFYVLVEMPEDIRIESDKGVCDQADLDISEMEYEHTGEIIITNQYHFRNHLKMIQVIPN